MYSLPNQTVSNHVTKVNLPGKHCTVTLKSSAVITSLEAILSHRFDIIQNEKFVLIQRKVKPEEVEVEDAPVVVGSSVVKIKSSNK